MKKIARLAIKKTEKKKEMDQEIKSFTTSL
jgi:hypothetical protein